MTAINSNTALKVERDLHWIRTNAPTASSRTDDIWFIDDKVGWAVNSNGNILHTRDGFETYEVQAHFPDLYLRCVAFANETTGWVGSVAADSPDDRLLATRDGGKTWKRVTNLPPDAPLRICGLYVLDEKTVVASGTNYPTEQCGFVRSNDGGASWTAVNLDDFANCLIDIYFRDAQEGWIVGGQDVVKHPGRKTERDDVVPVLLHTTDGGKTWVDLLKDMRSRFPRGEWGWKIQETSEGTMFVSLENLRDGAILVSADRGRSWTRRAINDRQRNSNLEGIGFLDANRGWVGGWGDIDFKTGATSRTRDGGATWDDANEDGFRLNRFRFMGTPLQAGYACGDTIYRLTDQAPPDGVKAAFAPLTARTEPIAYEIPENTRRLTIDVFERFGRRLARIAEEENPAAGSRRFEPRQLAFVTAEAPTAQQELIVRITTDDRSISHFFEG